MLRISLIVIVAVLLILAVGVAVFQGPALIGPIIILSVALIALVFESFRYRRLIHNAPGGNFSATGERFVDPESGKLVEVHSDPATGARRYVAIADADDTP